MLYGIRAVKKYVWDKKRSDLLMDRLKNSEMMKIKKNLKYVLNIFFIVVIGWLTVRLLFRGEEFSDIVADLHLAKKSWLAVGAVCVFCYVAGSRS